MTRDAISKITRANDHVLDDVVANDLSNVYDNVPGDVWHGTLKKKMERVTIYYLSFINFSFLIHWTISIE